MPVNMPHAWPRPGLCRPQFPDPGTGRAVTSARALLRRRGRLRLRRLASTSTMPPGCRRTSRRSTLGSFGYQRGLAAGSTAVGAGTLLAAIEGAKYNGPWDVPDNVRKLNGVLRYSQGTATDGFTLSAMAYSNGWNSTDQVAQRAIDQRLIGRFGTLDPTDGGNAQPLQPVQQLGAIERVRPEQGQRLCVRLVDAAVQQFYLFSRRPRQWRPVQPARPPHALWPQCQPHLRCAVRRYRNPDPRRPADARRRHPCRAVPHPAARGALDRSRRSASGKAMSACGPIPRRAGPTGCGPRSACERIISPAVFQRHAAKFRQCVRRP